MLLSGGAILRQLLAAKFSALALKNNIANLAPVTVDLEATSRQLKFLALDLWSLCF